MENKQQFLSLDFNYREPNSADKLQTNEYDTNSEFENINDEEWKQREHKDGSQSPTHQKFEISFGANLAINQSLKIETENRFKNEYEKHESLAGGSFGNVYKCVNKLDQKEYAIKEMSRKFFGKHKEYGLKEIRTLAVLSALEDNDYVVRYYCSWVQNDKLYVVMEYCPSSLGKEKAQRKSFSESELKKMLKHVCCGLNYLHKNDFIHADVKADNILISKNGDYKLGDLGQVHDWNHSKTSMDEGDWRYAAPELLNQHLSDTKLDFTKVDIFSLGLTILELATNEELPKSGVEYDQFRDNKFERLDAIESLSNEFKSLVKLMLSKDPSLRPSTQAILNHYLTNREELDQKWEQKVAKNLAEERDLLSKKLQMSKSRRRSIN